MNDLEKELVFSQSVKAGKRIYYFDVKQSRNGDRYVSITESKKIVEGSYENPRVSFEKHKLFLYKEDYEKFLNAFLNTLEIAKTGIVPAPVQDDAVQPESSASATQHEVKPQYEQAAVEEQMPVMAAEPIAEVEKPIVKEEPAVEAKTADDTFKIDLDF